MSNDTDLKSDRICAEGDCSNIIERLYYNDKYCNACKKKRRSRLQVEYQRRRRERDPEQWKAELTAEEEQKADRLYRQNRKKPKNKFPWYWKQFLEDIESGMMPSQLRKDPQYITNVPEVQ